MYEALLIDVLLFVMLIGNVLLSWYYFGCSARGKE